MNDDYWKAVRLGGSYNQWVVQNQRTQEFYREYGRMKLFGKDSESAKLFARKLNGEL